MISTAVIMSALELGFIYALVALALFLSFRVLNIADMTTDGTFTLGCAVSATVAVAGHPLLALPAAMIAAYGEDIQTFIRQKGEKYYPDLKAINALALRRSGVRHIEISDACTACEPDRFWSHRVTKGQRGSQGAVIVCKEVRG